MVDPSEQSEATRLNAARMQLREQLANGYAFVQSTHVTEMIAGLTVDDVRKMELEQIEGPEISGLPLAPYINRRVSKLQLIEEVRRGVLSAIESLRNDESLAV